MENKNKEVWKKWWFWVIVIVIFSALLFTESDNTINNNEIIEENDNSLESNITQIEEETELNSELFGDSDDKKNYFFNNEKIMRKFILAYNEKANVKITDVEWKNNHQMANIKFKDMSAEFNTGSDVGFLIEFEFENGKENINQYKALIKDIIFTFDSKVREDTFNEAFNNAQNNQYSPSKVTDYIVITMHYSEEQIGYKSGDRYYIEITCSNYNK